MKRRERKQLRERGGEEREVEEYNGKGRKEGRREGKEGNEMKGMKKKMWRKE